MEPIIFDPNSANTQSSSTAATYIRICSFLAPNISVLDYSAGKGHGSDIMRRICTNVKSYEPFPVNWHGTKPVDYTSHSNIPSNSADFVTNIHALNVVPLQTRNFIVSDISRIVKNGGIAIFAAREKIRAKSKIPTNETNGYLVQNQGLTVYQKAFTIRELKGYLSEQLPNWKVWNSGRLVVCQKPETLDTSGAN